MDVESGRKSGDERGEKWSLGQIEKRGKKRGYVV